MCFSAEASFGASVVLGTVGVVTIKKVKSPNQVPFASIPLLFSAQQFAEGVLWIGLSSADHESWRDLPIYIFLIFAQLVWPVWIPLSSLQLESHRKRRAILKLILGIGIGISLYLLYCLIIYDVKAEVHSGHILYTLTFPMAFAWITSALYFIPTVVPLFVSSIKKIQLLGLLVLASFIITKIYLEEHLISVWCFFAAILSILVLWIASKFKKNEVQMLPAL